MPARPVAVRHGERSAQGVCFSCRGHAAVPISSDLGWLLMSGSMSGLRRAGTRGNRGVGRVVGVLGGVSRPEFGGLVLCGSSVVGRRFVARSGRLSARHRCEAEGVA